MIGGVPLILLATENAAKAAELSAVVNRFLGGIVNVATLRDLPKSIEFPEESGSSFCEIASAKAKYAAESTGLICLGDDSGLCVDALEGFPGIRSRRWTGAPMDDRSRNLALIEALKEYQAPWTAAFVTCAALCFPDGCLLTATGECRGAIINTPRGENGFGYDPIFEVEGFGKTMAELSNEEKNSISHRARALENLLASSEIRNRVYALRQQGRID